ncbi:MAG: TonB family protein [Proteobacteria bacterium]|nr:MAG: TonB family protein [Pseudomonadota bacterium]
MPIEESAPEGTYTVVVRFIVSKDGSISDVVAETKHGYGMEQEAVKAIKKGPKWTPALQNGRHVNAYRRQPITFVVASE